MSKIAAGTFHTGIVSNDKLWVCGNNIDNQLGHHSIFKKCQTKFKPMKLEPKETPVVVSVFAGTQSLTFIDDQAVPWVCGKCNDKLGTARHHPQPLLDLPPILSGAASFAHSLLIDEEGFVWGYGKNTFRELGVEDNTERKLPVKISSEMPPIKSVCCGYTYSLFLDQQGTVWASGYTSFGKYRTKPTQIEGLPVITQISSGSAHDALLTEDGGVILFGKNTYGEMGPYEARPNALEATQINQILPPIDKVACSEVYSLFIAKDGSLWSFGISPFGSWENYKFQGDHPPVIDLALGMTHSVFMCNDGSVFTAGTNERGTLGIGNTKPSRKQTFHPSNLSVNIATSELKNARNCNSD